ncbi:MAG: hypothetical protein HYT88_03660, partial [Candidatus Omnitrophica bacterium]|nr:hypothetical protein [Candidatus Omnitrophota bacterium]
MAAASSESGTTLYSGFGGPWINRLNDWLEQRGWVDETWTPNWARLFGRQATWSVQLGAVGELSAAKPEGMPQPVWQALEALSTNIASLACANCVVRSGNTNGTPIRVDNRTVVLAPALLKQIADGSKEAQGLLELGLQWAAAPTVEELAVADPSWQETAEGWSRGRTILPPGARVLFNGILILWAPPGSLANLILHNNPVDVSLQISSAGVHVMGDRSAYSSNELLQFSQELKQAGQEGLPAAIATPVREAFIAPE